MGRTEQSFRPGRGFRQDWRSSKQDWVGFLGGIWDLLGLVKIQVRTEALLGQGELLGGAEPGFRLGRAFRLA